MIDFATSIQKTSKFPERYNAGKSYLGEIVVDEHAEGASAISDTARRLIGSKPAMYFTIAFAVGGLLGWLTSKR